MVVSIQATLSGYPGLILGNVVGSNIANVLLVGGVTAIVFPLLHDDPAIRRNAGIMVAAGVVFALMAVVSGAFTRVGGILLLGGFVVMMLLTAQSTLQAHRESDQSTPLDWVLGLPSRLGMILAFILAGVIMLPLGAERLVSSAVSIAAIFDVPEAVVGLTVLAIGTSLPELSTTVLAALERRSDIAIGAIVGSNTFNVLTIMGLTATVSSAPIEVSTRFLVMDIPVMLVSSSLLALYAWKARPMGRSIGVVMLVSYVAYLSTLYWVT